MSLDSGNNHVEGKRRQSQRLRQKVESTLSNYNTNSGLSDKGDSQSLCLDDWVGGVKSYDYRQYRKKRSLRGEGVGWR